MNVNWPGLVVGDDVIEHIFIVTGEVTLFTIHVDTGDLDFEVKYQEASDYLLIDNFIAPDKKIVEAYGVKSIRITPSLGTVAYIAGKR